MEITTKKRSFWEILTFQPAVEEVKFYNPLNIGVGSIVNVNYPEYSGMDFRVSKVSEYTRNLDSRIYFHTCYDLVSKALGSGKWTSIRLLVNPIKGATAEDAYPYSILLLKLDHEQHWDEAMTPVLEKACDEKKWVVDDDGKDDNGVQVSETYHDEYFRLNDLVDPYVATVAELEAEGGKLDPSNMRTRFTTYYDFARQVSDAPGVENTEFYIVEKDGRVEDEGYLTMWKGDEIDPAHVTVL